MTGFSTFFRKELTELARTWRLPVVGGVVLFFALTGPLLALFTPQLLESMQASQPGVVIQVPDPTWVDGYAQWVKNLTQIVTFILIIASAGAVAGEVASGTAVIVLTKPVSRSAFVVAKALALVVLAAVTVFVGTALTQLVTYFVFGEAPFDRLWLPVLVWLAFASVLIAVSVLLSSLVQTLAAAGMGIGVFFLLSLAGLWGPAVRYSPVGLASASTELLAGKEPALAWPLASAALVAVLLVIVGAAAFSRREI